MNQELRGGCSRIRPFSIGTVIVALGALLAAGCASRTPLANAYDSPNTLARAVLDALAANDRTRLDSLALSREEFEAHVWPSLPAARPERNLPVAYVWGDLRQKSSQSLTNTLKAHAGKRYQLLDVTFSDVTPYAGFHVHRDAMFRVRNADGGSTEIHVIGSMVEKDATWKVFSYVVD